jgi:hypothetical protein
MGFNSVYCFSIRTVTEMYLKGFACHNICYNHIRLLIFYKTIFLCHEVQLGNNSIELKMSTNKKKKHDATKTVYMYTCMHVEYNLCFNMKQRPFIKYD